MALLSDCENGDPKCYGPYGGDGGGFYTETPPGSYGFLAGISAAVVYSQGEEEYIATLEVFDRELKLSWKV
ncbi:hypothetical protein pdam_00013298 [Pocillopora damicornis]|uniref:Uncharacterized protein n=1 Tax=Pocillopora damicornis TaxID=46731 RepID=A0A3M6UIG7_POCDA|nr:hypothetical protein pdam_00013298 [Pocillopora damicornis]